MAGKLTTDEIALLHEAFRWARNHDVTRTAWGDAWRQGPDGKMVSRDENTIGWAPDRYTAYHWLAVDSVTQAVDVLVAVGFLPPRFSSAFQAGWRAADVWATPGDHEAEWKQLFDGPDGPDFPAVM